MSGVAAPPPSTDPVHRNASRRPHAPAVLADREIWTWSQLDARADTVAAAVAGYGGAPGDRVGLMVTASPLGVAAVHGLPRAAVVPVVVHPRLAGPEIAALLRMAGCRLLVTDDPTAERVPTGVAHVPLTEVSVQGGPASVGVDGASSAGELIVPTSGTTARPKLARLPLRAIRASAEAWNAFLPPATAWLLSLGLGHVAGIGVVARAAAGAVPVVVPRDAASRALLEAIQGARARGVIVSHLSLVATQLERLIGHAGSAGLPEGLRAVLVGGGPIPEELVVRALDAGWPIVPTYGMTETASGVAALLPEEARRSPWSAGRALPGTELRVDCDEPSGGPARPDEPAEIMVRGPSVFAGYLDDPEATAASLGPDGWLRTGDLGDLDPAGRLRVVDRRDDLIVSGGENVAPAEVEAALASHPGVLEVGVVGAPDPEWDRIPVAYVVPRPGAAPTDEELTAHVRLRLAPYKVPARFVRVAELPRSPSGKLLRRRLASMVEARSPGSTRSHAVTVDDGQRIAVRLVPGPSGPVDGPAGRPVDSGLPVVLLHATLSSTAQLLPLARRLSETTGVVLVDRRGSGASRMPDPRPVPLDRHVADVVGVLDDLGLRRVALVGHSFGGVVALEVAARHPDRVAAVFAWEPPYLPLADGVARAALDAVADRVAEAYAEGGSEAAARTFLGIVAGPAAWDRLHPRQRAAIAEGGAGALADVSMEGLDPGGLARIVAPTILATGSASEPFYAPIADALADRIGPATRIDLDGLRHPAPITDPARVADLVIDLLVRAAAARESDQ